jgi:hypothetical protein
MYNLSNFKEIKVGEKLKDSFIGSEWLAISKDKDTVVIQNIKGGEKGTRIYLKDNSFFFTLEPIT